MGYERRGYGGGGGANRFRPKTGEEGKEYDVDIKEISRRGEGIARVEGLVVFVPKTKPGDDIKIKITRGSNRFASGEVIQSEWPDPSIFPYFYAKPITWFAYFSFVYWAAGLESNKDHFLKLSPRVRNMLFLGTALVAFASFYEIFYNFMVWLALEVLTTNCLPFPCNPDKVASIFDLKSPLNLVFATKIVTTAFVLSIYSLWFLHRVDLETERQNRTATTVDSDVKAPVSIPSRKHIEIETGLAAQHPVDPTIDKT